MSTFTKYLTEATKTYEYKIKIAGDIEKDFGSRMETALQKFEVQSLSAGKKTPIQSLPLDFPGLSNQAVHIFDLKTSYPSSVHEMKEYIADHMNKSPDTIVVRRAGEPTEEYQDQMQVTKKSEYKNKLHDIEYNDAPKVTGADWHSTKANMSLLKELLKDREKNDNPKEKENILSKEDAPANSPLTKATNPHPDPKRK
jgi:hypothetical protein